jgi:hypothetical protein
LVASRAGSVVTASFTTERFARAVACLAFVSLRMSSTPISVFLDCVTASLRRAAAMAE